MVLHITVNDGKLLINLDFNPLLMERVNKYVEAFEADYNKEYAYDDAYTLFRC